MKKISSFIFFFFFSMFLWAKENNTSYYNIASIQKDFPTSKVERKQANYDIIQIENALQGYTIFLYHYPENTLAKNMYYDTLRQAAKQDLLIFPSKTGYTSLLDTKQGIVYGLFVEDKDFISVRFYNADIIPDILNVLNEKMLTWKNF